jgi:hypothetical protein
LKTAQPLIHQLTLSNTISNNKLIPEAKSSTAIFSASLSEAELPQNWHAAAQNWMLNATKFTQEHSKPQQRPNHLNAQQVKTMLN